MGEYADLVLDGVLDMYTGEFLGDACGYPRSLEDEQECEREQKKRPKIGEVREKHKYRCNICGKYFKTNKGLVDHISHMHRRGEKTHDCKVCGTMCRGQEALEQHMRDKGCSNDTENR